MSEHIPQENPNGTESSATENKGLEKQEKEFEELQKENFEEHEKWQVKLKEVVSAIQKKSGAIKEVARAMRLKRDIRGLAPEDVHLLIIVLGGGMQGPYGAGQMSALQEMGCVDRNLDQKDAFIGISVGAATCAFGMAGKKQALLGTSYFYTVCASSAFIKYARMNKIIDISVVEKALRAQPTRLDTRAVMKNPAQFYVQAYNETEKSPELINAKDPGIDMINAIHASMAIPLVYDKAIVIRQSRYTDGAFDDPLPLARAIEKFKPTHVLILPNVPFNRIPLEDPSRMGRILLDMIPDVGSLGFIRKVLDNRQVLRRAFDTMAEHHGVKIGVAWPPEMGLHTFIQDKPKIKAAIREAAKSMFTLFGESERNLKLYEEEYPKG
jgi:predicted patatin/cPLA2 family phospholipase